MTGCRRPPIVEGPSQNKSTTSHQKSFPRRHATAQWYFEFLRSVHFPAKFCSIFMPFTKQQMAVMFLRISRAGKLHLRQRSTVMFFCMRPSNPSGGRFNRHMIAPWSPIFGRRRSYQSWQQQVHHGNASYSRRLFSHSACVVTALPRRRLITPSLGKIRCSDDVIETFHRRTVFFIHVPSILVLSRKIALCGDFLWFTKWYDMEADGSFGYAYYYYFTLGNHDPEGGLKIRKKTTKS